MYISPESQQDWDTAVAEMNPKALMLLEEAKNHTSAETIAAEDLIDDGCRTKGWYDMMHEISPVCLTIQSFKWHEVNVFFCD